MTEIAKNEEIQSTEASQTEKREDGLLVKEVTSERPAPRIRDEVFWTELEIRRLSNIVAEAINSRRYVGTSLVAVEERQQMRVFIEAMKRKAMRVLHRAELFACSEHAAWPGIDATIADPVSLAEEYVRLVEDYLAEVSAEEERAHKEEQARVIDTKGDMADADEEDMEGIIKKPETMDAGTDTEKDKDRGKANASDEPQDWVVADDEAFQEALREHKGTESKGRSDLLGVEGDGVRRRRKGTSNKSEGIAEGVSYSKDDEEEVARQQPVQAELTSNLIDLVGQLKQSVTENKQRLEQDKKVLDDTEMAVDKNVDSVTRQRNNLKAFSQSASTSWWVMLGAALVIILVFLFMVLLISVPL